MTKNEDTYSRGSRKPTIHDHGSGVGHDPWGRFWHIIILDQILLKFCLSSIHPYATFFMVTFNANCSVINLCTATYDTISEIVRLSTLIWGFKILKNCLEGVRITIFMVLAITWTWIEIKQCVTPIFSH